MASYCVHPKDVPEAFKVIRHVMMVLSITLTTLCIFIVKRSASITPVYANLLVLLLIFSVIVDVFVQWIFDPGFLSPLMCMYRRAPIINVPLSAAACSGDMQSALALCGLLYFALFMYRHQAIVPPQSRFKFSVAAQTAFLAVLSVPYALLGVTFYMGRLGSRERPDYVQHMGDDWDEAVLDRVDCFRMKNNYFYLILCFLVPIFTVLFIFAVARHTFLVLREVKHISLKMQQLHRILTKALIVQMFGYKKKNNRIAILPTFSTSESARVESRISAFSSA